MALTFGRVPHPGFVDLQHTTAGKPEGIGWNNLGRRSPKFVVLHRMVGTLRGTDVHFANPTVGALTDYGLGVGAVDGQARAGEIHKYNDPTGVRSGWASGPVSSAYGDGAAIVNTYGINAVNRDGVSIEISGYRNEPLDDFAWGELVKLVAYWIDFMKIPHSSLPRNPHTGINAILWHQEFTIGTGKECPFEWVMTNTDRLYADVAAYLKPFQEGKEQAKPTTPTAPTPETPPAPQAKQAFTTRYKLPIRQAPGFNGKVIKELAIGTTGTIINGPQKQDGIDWYDVRIPGQGFDGTGWVPGSIVRTLDIKG